MVEAGAEEGCTPGPVVHQSHRRGRGGSTQLHRTDGYSPLSSILNCEEES